MNDSPKKALSIDVLRGRDFRCLLFTRMFMIMAMMVQDVIIGWQIYSITKDPFMLGLTGLAEAIPAIICALFAGHVVDINKPHRIYGFCAIGLAINSFILMLVAGGSFHVDNHVLIICLFGGIFVSGVARSFIAPCSFTLLSQVVTRANLPPASAWMTSSFQMAAIAGPAIAGIIYGGYGVGIAWKIPFVLLCISIFALSSMGEKPKNYKSPEKREIASKSIKAGWSFILNSPVLLSVMLLDMFAVLFGGAVAMLPAYADQVLRVGSEGLGILRAAPAVGAIFTALFLALRPFKVVKATTMLWVVGGFGCCIIGFGLSRVFPLSLLFLLMSGAFDSVSMVIRGTLMQLLTPDSMRGRVSAVNSMFIISSNEIGAFESGTAAKLLGLVPSIVFGGICTILVATATAALSPKLRRIVVSTDIEKQVEK